MTRTLYLGLRSTLEEKGIAWRRCDSSSRGPHRGQDGAAVLLKPERAQAQTMQDLPPQHYSSQPRSPSPFLERVAAASARSSWEGH